MEEYRFAELVRKERGFEFCQAFRNEKDIVMGGRDGKFWFIVMQDQTVKETYAGTLEGGVWSDRRISGRGKRKKITEMPPGSTVRRIEERAYFMQDAEWVAGRKPRLLEDPHPRFHYTYGIGERALDVSETFGVSTGYSDLKDPEAGFRLRFLYTGQDVEDPD